MNKQDRGGVRTAQDLERKYNLAGMAKAVRLQEEGIHKTQTTLENFINNTLKGSQSMQSQADGEITTWFAYGEPTLDDEPATYWTTDGLKKNHAGDLYYDRDTGNAYIFELKDGAYKWSIVEDSATRESLAIANSEYDTSDNKRRVFTAQPYPPYENGDLWFDGTDIYICQISKASVNVETGEAEVYEKDDFIIATKYTDNTIANQVGQDLIVLSGAVSKIRQSVDEVEATVKKQEETVDGLSEKQAKVEVTADKIHWLIQDSADATASDFSMTSDAVKIMTDELGIDALVEFKNSAENGTSTVINGGSIDTDSLFSREIHATNLHISEDSCFEGAMAIAYVDTNGKDTAAVMSIKDNVISTSSLSYDGNEITSPSSARLVPCFEIDAAHGLVVTGPIKADYLSANSFYGAKGAFTSTITRSLVTENIEAIGSIKSGGKTVSLDGHTHNYAGSTSAGGDANNALKLGGRSLTADGNRWGSVPFVGDDGVMEVGRYIDFHLSDADTGTSGDTTGGRLEADGTNLKFKDKKLATIEGSQTAARTGKIVIGNMAIVYGVVSVTSGTSAADGLYTGNATANFGVTFAYAPVITASFSGRQDNMRAIGTSSVTTTSANIWGKFSGASSTRSIQWVAIGQLA